MDKRVIVVFLLALPALAASSGEQALDPLDQWPQWRGPLGSGVAPHASPPVQWSEDENVRWKAPIPGLGHSTPVVWGDLVFLTTAIPIGEELEPQSGPAHGAHDNFASLHRQEFVVLAVDGRDGEIAWRKTVRGEQPHEGMHVTGSWASNSPVTDGERLFAFFGSGGLYCLDLNGELLWETDFGDMESKHGHGEGSSPALHGDTLVINWDHEGESFVVALDKGTGDERWKVERDEGTSWSTPLVVEHGGKPQVIVSATHRVRGYDLATGEVVWECGGMSGNVVASPVAADGMVYVASSYEKQAMMAIRLASAKGDITATDAIAWTRNHQTPYVPSPLLYGDTLYFIRHLQGYLSCVEAKTGKTHYGSQRLPGVRRVYASPLGAADRVYVVGRGGVTYVLRRGADLDVLARNVLDDTFSASPAAVGDKLYLRGERHLYCIAEDGAEEGLDSGPN